MTFTEEEMKENGYIAWRILPDGDVIAVGPMLLGNGRLFLGININGYEDCYCYDSVELAKKSMDEYDPESGIEPQGWKRHPYSGRRRPNGDASKEYVNF